MNYLTISRRRELAGLKPDPEKPAPHLDSGVGAGFCSFGAAVLSFMAFVHLPQHVAEVSGDRMHEAAIISAIEPLALLTLTVN